MQFLKELAPYLRLMRFDKPIGIFLLLWPALWALWLAGAGHPDKSLLVIFVLGVIVMRAAGCVINDIADRKVDGFVRRTASRPIASGEVPVKNAVILFAVLMAVALMLVLMCNWLTVALAFVGAALTSLYPFLKRITHLPQLGLGLAFSWSVPMAFAAQTGYVPMQAWLLFAAACLWPVIYDTFYAMADREDDIKVGVKSTAILAGNHDRQLIALLQVGFIAMLLLVQYVFCLNAIFMSSLFVAALLFIYQQYLVRARYPGNCFAAFLNNNWVGFVIFVGIMMSIK